MRTSLTDLEIAVYQVNGFVVLPDFLTDEELAGVREATVKLAGAPGEGLSNYRGNRTAFADPRCAEILLSEGIGKIASQAESLEKVRYLSDAISYVTPGHGATPYHVNMHEGLPISTAHAVSFCIPLDDYRWNTKAMNFLPGTHKSIPLDVFNPSPSLRPGGTRFDQLLDDYPYLREIRPVVAEGPAGSAIVSNPLGVHGSAPNMTTITRRAIGAFYYGDGELFTGGTYTAPAEGYPDAEAGEPLRSRYTPVIWPADAREVA
jgi:phytanoyl-CoA hydroxylase